MTVFQGHLEKRYFSRCGLITSSASKVDEPWLPRGDSHQYIHGGMGVSYRK